MAKQIKSIEDFLMEHGGVVQIGLKLQISPWNVMKWKERGIPQKFWDKITQVYGFSPGELYSFTKKAKQQKAA